MSGVNVQVSVTNLPQYDRHQSEIHRAPVVNQEQNAEIARAGAMQRVIAPAQPEQAEGKTVDPEARRKEDEKRKKKRRKSVTQEEAGPKRHPDGGHIVDIEA